MEILLKKYPTRVFVLLTPSIIGEKVDCISSYWNLNKSPANGYTENSTWDPTREGLNSEGKKIYMIYLHDPSNVNFLYSVVCQKKKRT